MNTIESLVQDSATRRLEHATLDFASGTDRQMAGRGSRITVIPIQSRRPCASETESSDSGSVTQQMEDPLSKTWTCGRPGESAREWIDGRRRWGIIMTSSRLNPRSASEVGVRSASSNGDRQRKRLLERRHRYSCFTTSGVVARGTEIFGRGGCRRPAPVVQFC